MRQTTFDEGSGWYRESRRHHEAAIKGLRGSEKHSPGNAGRPQQTSPARPPPSPSPVLIKARNARFYVKDGDTITVRSGGTMKDLKALHVYPDGYIAYAIERGGIRDGITGFVQASDGKLIGEKAVVEDPNDVLKVNGRWVSPKVQGTFEGEEELALIRTYGVNRLGHPCRTVEETEKSLGIFFHYVDDQEYPHTGDEKVRMDAHAKVLRDYLNGIKAEEEGNKLERWANEHQHEYREQLIREYLPIARESLAKARADLKRAEASNNRNMITHGRKEVRDWELEISRAENGSFTDEHEATDIIFNRMQADFEKLELDQRKG